MEGNDMTIPRNANQLAGLADCTCPDGPDSPGARFLMLVADSVAEAMEYDTDGVDDAYDMANEAADGCVPIYTHPMWQTFVDLEAFKEDVSDIAQSDTDMENMARIALYQIGERLALALIEEALATVDD